MGLLYRFTKIQSVAELLYTDGRTDRRTDGLTYMMKLIVVFHNLAKAPKTETLCNFRVLLDKNLLRKIFIFLVS